LNPAAALLAISASRDTALPQNWGKGTAADIFSPNFLTIWLEYF
jgi:hypothetical protein